MAEPRQRSAVPATDRLAQAILDGRLRVIAAQPPDAHGVHVWTFTVTVDPAVDDTVGDRAFVSVSL